MSEAVSAVEAVLPPVVWGEALVLHRKLEQTGKFAILVPAELLTHHSAKGTEDKEPIKTR
jgi:hypothetical protein